ncbi:KdsC family phosphatase [Sphingobacterium lactis]|uniref:KdsC family phosphatase n=1 Tax=Sphingobacterium lactis TaxID=797291 RepID=UPI003F7E3CBA
MIFQKLKQIKAVILDVDGVMTDGSIHVTEEGHQLRTFYVKDGYAMQLAIKRGLPIWVISGGRSEGVRKRMLGLGITEVHLGVSDKLTLLQDLMSKYNLIKEDLLYMGDDLPDFEVMQAVGFACCPSDSIEEIKEISHYMSPFAGGKGAVRDILEKVMKLQGIWSVETSIKSI